MRPMRVHHSGFTIDSPSVAVTDRNVVASLPCRRGARVIPLSSADSELLEGEREAAAVGGLLHHVCWGGGEGGQVAGRPGVEAGDAAGEIDLLSVVRVLHQFSG